MAFAFRKYFRIKQGKPYQTGDYVVCLSDKDWHYGSKVPSGNTSLLIWILTITPSIYKTNMPLNQCYNFKRTGKVEHTFKDIRL